MIDLVGRKDINIINVEGCHCIYDISVREYVLNGIPKYEYKYSLPKKLINAYKSVTKAGKIIIHAAGNEGEELQPYQFSETQTIFYSPYFFDLLDKLNSEEKLSIAIVGNLDPDTRSAIASSNKPGKRTDAQERFLFAPAGKVKLSYTGEVFNGGTSLAAPYICAAVANLLSKSKTLTPKKALNILLESSEKQQDVATYGRGIIRASRALEVLDEPLKNRR